MAEFMAAPLIPEPGADNLISRIDVPMGSRGIEPAVHLTQYDRGIRIIAVTGTYDSASYVFPTGCAVNVRMEKPDGTAVYNPVLGLSHDRKTAYITVTEQMTAVAGVGRAVIEVSLGDGIVCTGRFLVLIKENPVPAAEIKSESEFLTFSQLVESMREYANSVWSQYPIYEGRNLEEIFVEDIAAKGGDPWEWIHLRIDSGDFAGIRVGDYIPFDATIVRIIGINTYKGYAQKVASGYNQQDAEYATVPDHIDFMFTYCPSWFRTSNTWNIGGENIGADYPDSKCPWIHSQHRKRLEANYTNNNNRLTAILPHVSNKLLLMETRSSAEVDKSDGCEVVPMGHFWLPTEYEVFGTSIYGTPVFSAGPAIQYPYFRTIAARTPEKNKKMWLATLAQSTEICGCWVDNGGPGRAKADSNTAEPYPCFRIAARG